MQSQNRGDITERYDAYTAGIDAFIMPSFFLGVISQLPLEHDCDSHLFEGQFLYQHQYNGHGCAQAHCRGIFFPVGNIGDTTVKAKLLALPKAYGLNSCRNDDFPQLQRDWKNIGNLEVLPLDYQYGTAEALFRFEPALLLKWLRPLAPYVVEFSAVSPEEIDPKSIPIDEEQILDWSGVSGWPPDKVREAHIEGEIAKRCGTSRVAKVEPAPWQSIDEFKKWLIADGKEPLRTKVWNPETKMYETRINDIVGAFIYPNGD